MKKETIAVFDFDGTITTKDTLLEFIKFSRGYCKLYSGFLIFGPLLIAMKLNLLPNWKVKQLIFTYFYKGISIKKFSEWGAEFSAIIDKILCVEAMDAISLHKKSNNKIFVVSASIENWIKPWADKNGIDMVLATSIESNENGLLTGKFLTKNCYGQEKVNRILEVLPNRNDYNIVAYGDSRGDRELLEFADDGFYRCFC